MGLWEARRCLETIIVIQPFIIMALALAAAADAKQPLRYRTIHRVGFVSSERFLLLGWRTEWARFRTQNKDSRPARLGGDVSLW